MFDLSPVPASLPRKLTIVARWSLWLVFAGWFVFLATWGAMHWLIVPRIGEFRPLLESRVAQALGVPVRIGAISAQSNGLIPSLEISNVELFDAQGRVALRLPRVLAAVSPRSLWRMGFEQLYVDQPELSIRRDGEGRISVAGLDFAKSQDSSNGALDWFFSQVEFAIHDGTVLWTDELRGAPTLALTQVDLVVRNQRLGHSARLDATPPEQWGGRFTLRGRFQQPLLARHKGRWQDWRGQLYAAFPRIDLSQLRRHADVGLDIAQGTGALTAWVDVDRAKVVDAVTDLALGQVSVTLGEGLQALELQSVRGRLTGRALTGGFDLSARELEFDTNDGLHWPGGNIGVLVQGPQGRTPARGELSADRLNLAALSQIAGRLPIAPSLRERLLAHAPEGLVERFTVRWQGPPENVSRYQAKGVITGLGLAAVGAAPGVRGASVEFDFNQSAGRARLALAQGSVALPTIFDEPEIAVSALSADISWQVEGQRIAVQLPNLKFENADAQGQARIKWETSDPGRSPAHERFPGVLDLQAEVTRADGTRVHRYLPSVIGLAAREYVRDAVLAGTASGAKFRVRGDLNDMPFKNSKQGEFRITADVKDATLAYVPRTLQAAAELPWPALTQLSGELVIDGVGLQVRRGSASLASTPGVRIDKVQAQIADLAHPTVVVDAQAQGPLAEMLAMVKRSPLAAMTGQALSRAYAVGTAQYKLKLNLPIDSLNKSRVQGAVTLAGNDLQMTPDTPRLTRAQGVVSYTENGFSIVGGQARMLGGEVRIEGGTVAASGSKTGNVTAAPTIEIRANGTASAEGLRQASELGLVARLAQQATGSAAYTAVLGFRQGEPELMVSSSLQGMGLSLPAPLAKSAPEPLAFALKTSLVRDSLQPTPGGPQRLRDQLRLEVGSLASITYLRDLSGEQPRVLRGSIGVGLTAQESVPLPDQGVVANIVLDAVDLDAWAAVLSPATLAGSVGASSAAIMEYLPTSVALRARELNYAGRRINHVVLGGSREDLLWQANLDADELDGYVQYRQSSGAGPGRLHARLAKLIVAASTASEVEALLAEQPTSIPALDIVAEDFELRGKRMGRLEVEAINRGEEAQAGPGNVREWRLNKFNVSTPEAVFTASGNWASVSALNSEATTLSARNWPGRKRTVLNFKLEILDGGELMNRFGMKDVVKKGQGRMAGQVAWMGSPISLDYPSLTGALAVNVEKGQFLKADPGIAKLLGVLSLQALPRRLTLDFRDVFSEGFSFDFLRGNVVIEQGIAKTNNLQMKGVNAAVLMEGSADIARETQDIRVVVVPEISAGTASLIATIINPVVGIGSFLAQFFLQRPLTEAATQSFHIDGSWADPKITKVERRAEAAKTARNPATERPPEVNP